jgi:hypothetical protein
MQKADSLALANPLLSAKEETAFLLSFWLLFESAKPEQQFQEFSQEKPSQQAGS